MRAEEQAIDVAAAGQQKEEMDEESNEDEKIDDQGLHITVKDQPQILDVDHVIICAGQLSNKALYQEQSDHHHIIGGAENNLYMEPGSA